MPGSYPNYKANTMDTRNDIPGRRDIANAADFNSHDSEILSHQAVLLNHEGRIVTLESGASITSLSALTDVRLTSPSSDQILSYNGSKWVNIDANVTASGLVPYTGANKDIYVGNNKFTTDNYVWASGIVTPYINAPTYPSIMDLTLTAGLFKNVVITGGGTQTYGDGGDVLISGANGGFFGGAGGDIILSVGKPHSGDYTSVGAGEIIFRGNFNWKKVSTIDYAGTLGILGSTGGVPAIPDTEYIANGDFVTDTIWYKGIVNWTISGGKARFDVPFGASSGGDLLQTNLTITLGQWYDVTYTITDLSGYLSQLTASIGSATDSVGPIRTTAGTFTDTLRASSYNLALTASSQPGPYFNGYIYLNHVSIKKSADFTKGSIYASGNDLVIKNPYPTRGRVNFIDSTLVTAGDTLASNSYLSASGIFQNISTQSITASGNISAAGVFEGGRLIIDKNGTFFDDGISAIQTNSGGGENARIACSYVKMATSGFPGPDPLFTYSPLRGGLAGIYGQQVVYSPYWRKISAFVDGTSFLDFYSDDTPTKKIVFNQDSYLASNMVPTASGVRQLGTIPLPFASGVFKSLMSDNIYMFSDINSGISAWRMPSPDIAAFNAIQAQISGTIQQIWIKPDHGDPYSTLYSNLNITNATISNPTITHWGHVNGHAEPDKYIEYVIDTDGYYKLTRMNTDVLGMQINMPLDIGYNNVTASGNITASGFYGDGSHLTGLIIDGGSADSTY